MLKKLFNLPKRYMNKVLSLILAFYFTLSPLLVLGASPVIAEDVLQTPPDVVQEQVVEEETVVEPVEVPQTPVEVVEEVPQIPEPQVPVVEEEQAEEEEEQEVTTPDETEVLVVKSDDGTLETDIVEVYSCQANSINPCVITDKEDYAPTEIVELNGYGYNPNTQYLLVIYSNDNPPVRYESVILSDENGAFSYSYQLDGTYRPNYSVEVRSIEPDGLVAEHTFTDSPSNHGNNPHGNRGGGGGAVCPHGDVKYEVDEADYEYTDGSATVTIIPGPKNSATWEATSGYEIVSVCIKIGGPGGGTLKDGLVDGGGPFAYDISHIVINTEIIEEEQELPSLTIVKESNPSSYEKFNFERDFGTTFKLKNGENVQFTELLPGSYTVSEKAKMGWTLAGISCDSESVTVNLQDREVTVDLHYNENVTCTFENVKLGKISGYKYNDRNGNGVKNHNETGLGYWKIFIDENADGEYNQGEEYDTTSSFFLNRGFFKFDNLTPGTYTVCEEMKEDWYNSTPVCQDVEVEPDGKSTVNFGNHQSLKIQAHKVVCDSEEYLPNWLDNWAPISSTFAQDWVSQSDGHCELVDGWKFQYAGGYSGSVGDFQTDVSELGGPWVNFYSGETLEVTDFSEYEGVIQVREVFPSDSYVGYSNSANNYTAEIYCEGDVNTYDNWEWITDYKYGDTYHCVAFNALKTGNLEITKSVLDPDGEEVEDSTTEFTITVEGVGTVELTDDESHTFTNVQAGTYTVTEDANGNYTFDSFSSDEDSEISGAQVVVVENGTTTLTVYNRQNTGEIIVYKDVVNESQEDVYSDDVFEAVLTGDDFENETKEISDSQSEPKVAVYSGLNPGEYALTENPSEGYIFNGCYNLTQIVDEIQVAEVQNAQTPITVLSGQIQEFVCVNEEITPELELTKSNDSVAPQLAGTTVTYTLTVTAPMRDNSSEDVELLDLETPYVLNDVKVTDLTPDGFEYVEGTWTAVKNGTEDLKASNVVLEPTYASPGQWNLGTMVEGDVVVLTYVAKISEAQNPGLYKDIAWTQGTSLTGSRVIGSTSEVGDVFAGTNVAVIEDIEEGNAQVLGVSLPNTGSEWVYVLLAALSLVLGIGLLFVGGRKKVNVVALIIPILFTGFVTLINPTEASAATHSIRLSEPKSPNGNVDSKISFAVLDIDSRAMEVTCYVKKPGEVAFTVFGTVLVPAGGNSGHCTTGESVLSTDGNYEFYVTADASGDVVSSSTVALVLDTELPEIVEEYSKTEGVCQYTLSFRVADDSQTTKIQIFRSSETSFPANSSTLLTTLNVVSGQDVEYTDSELPNCNDDYYYAVRAVDVANNSSDFVTDSIVTIQGGAQGQAGGGEVQGEDTQGEGDGNTDGEIKGEDDEGKDNDGGTKGEGDEDIDKSSKSSVWDWLKYVLLVILGLVVGGGVYVYVKGRSSKVS